MRPSFCSYACLVAALSVSCARGAVAPPATTSGAHSDPAAAAPPEPGATPPKTEAHGAGPASAAFPASVSKPRIMIVGDSISAGPGCYKKYLLKNLIDHHYSRFEFVGEYGDDCGSSVRHSAVSCSSTEHYTQQSFTMANCFQGQSFPGLSTLLAKHQPDLLLLQLGVNDVWGGKPTAEILENYTKLLEQARAANPHIVVVVAQIQKMRPNCGSDDTLQKAAEALVLAVPEWARQRSTAASKVLVADLWTNSDWSRAETLDCVHPNEVGAERMGLNWFNALKAILRPD